MSTGQFLQSNWNYPNAIQFGAGRTAELPRACADLGIERPLLVTDPILAELPMVHQALDHCRDEGLACGLFTGLRPNPAEQNVLDGVPHTLADLGVTEDAIERLAVVAEVDPSATTNPVPLNRDNLARLFRNAIDGRLARGEETVEESATGVMQ